MAIRVSVHPGLESSCNGRGFLLQDALAPHKRPFHTIGRVASA
jgi:hypothetical protein